MVIKKLVAEQTISLIHDLGKELRSIKTQLHTMELKTQNLDDRV